MEPLFLDIIPPDLADTASEVSIAAERIGGRLHPATLGGLTNLVRIMNCYYSNLIEGHPTRPRDIEAALRSGGTEITSAIPGNPDRERLLKLSLAHIETQEWIDTLHVQGRMPDPAGTDFVQSIHRRFYENLPADFREIRHGKATVARTMVAGRMRGPGEEVDVGRHAPPSGGAAVGAFMATYAGRYGSLRSSGMGPVQKLCGIAAAHHRLLYVHPFDDGNGRVARLVTHAMLLDAGLGAFGLWSMSRGMARGIRPDSVKRPRCLDLYAGAAATAQYKLMMAHADQGRMGDMDGRGNLSRQRLQEFCDWFLAVALDQLTFMGSNLHLDDLTRNLVARYVPRRRLDPRLGRVLAEIARLGELPRGSVKTILDVSARTATQMIATLLSDGIVTSRGHRDPLRLSFNLAAAEVLFPGLFGVEALLGVPADVVVTPGDGAHPGVRRIDESG